MRKTLWFAALALLLAGQAHAAVIHFEGFEDPAWTPSVDNWNNFIGADIQRVSSGTNGITSRSGIGHAILTNLSEQNNVFNNPTLGTRSPFTRFGGYSSSFGGGFTTSLDIYLDPSWSSGQGFDYSVAANRQDGTHLRDFIFHVGIVDGSLLVNASNNSDLSFNGWKLENENGGNNYTVATAGWYTFEQVFYDNGGQLAVDLRLLDSGGTVLHTITRTTSDDIATVVGGNRYGWFTFNNIDGLAIDNTTLETAAVPEPATLALLGLGLLGVGLRRRLSRQAGTQGGKPPVRRTLTFAALGLGLALGPAAAHAVMVTTTYTGDNVVAAEYCQGAICTSFPAGANGSDWRNADTFAVDLAPGAYTFVFEVTNAPSPTPTALNPAGFLAQLAFGGDTLLTSAAWEVSLDGVTWIAATEWAQNDGSNADPYDVWWENNTNQSVAGISTNAQWLWTVNNFAVPRCSDSVTAGCTDEQAFFRVQFAIPEPVPLALLGLGLAALGLARRRSRG